MTHTFRELVIGGVLVAPDLVCRRDARPVVLSLYGTPAILSRLDFRLIQSSIGRERQPLCHRPGTAGFALLTEMSMDTASPERAIASARSPSKIPSRSGRNVQAITHPTNASYARAIRTTAVPCRGYRRPSDTEKSGFLSAMLQRLATVPLPRRGARIDRDVESSM